MDSETVAPEIEYYEHEINSGGARIVLSAWARPQPVASLVFIPATMVHPLIYEPMLNCLANADFAVFGLHPVGHGKSARDVKRYTINDIVQNGRDAVTFALERYKLPVVVMGSSQGGLVAAALASVDDRVSVVFAHNLMLSEIPDSIGVSRFPMWIRHIYRPFLCLLRMSARLFPDVQVPLKFYLDRSRISHNSKFWEAVERDILSISRYSLWFLTSLLTTRFPGLTNGAIKCPVYILIDTGDKLFTEAYMQKVYDRVAAPYKEMVAFNFSDHMIMVTNPHEVCEKVIGKIKEALGLPQDGAAD